MGTQTQTEKIKDEKNPFIKDEYDMHFLQKAYACLKKNGEKERGNKGYDLHRMTRMIIELSREKDKGIINSISQSMEGASNQDFLETISNRNGIGIGRFVPTDEHREIYDLYYARVVLNLLLRKQIEYEDAEQILLGIRHRPLQKLIVKLVISVMKGAHSAFAYIEGIAKLVEEVFKLFADSISSDDEMLDVLVFLHEVTQYYCLVRGTVHRSRVSSGDEIGYLSYFIADAYVGIMIDKKPLIDVIELSLLTELMPEDRAKAFGVWGVFLAEEPESWQKAYDVYSLWLTRSGHDDDRINNKKEKIYENQLRQQEEMEWRETAKGKKHLAAMHSCLAHVCKMISETHAYNGLTHEIFRNRALDNIRSAVRLDDNSDEYRGLYAKLLMDGNIEDVERAISVIRECSPHASESREYKDMLIEVLTKWLILFRHSGEALSESRAAKERKMLDQLIAIVMKDWDEHNGCEWILGETAAETGVWEDVAGIIEYIRGHATGGSQADIDQCILRLAMIRVAGGRILKLMERKGLHTGRFFTRSKEEDGRIKGEPWEYEDLYYYSVPNTVLHLFERMTKDGATGAVCPIDSENKSGSIIQKNCFTVMHVNYMNDPEEGVSLLKAIDEEGGTYNEFRDFWGSEGIAEMRKKIMGRQFVFLKSFTDVKDKLHMWNRYASNRADGKDSDGCCVQLDTSVFLNGMTDITENGGGRCLSMREDRENTLYRVVYLTREPDTGKYVIDVLKNPWTANTDISVYYDELLDSVVHLTSVVGTLHMDPEKKEVLNGLMKKFLCEVFSELVFLFKMDSYSDEDESRLIIMRPHGELTKVRVLPGENPQKVCVHPFFQVYVREIMFGPNADEADDWIPIFQYKLAEMWKNRISHGDAPFEVTKSQIVYRN